MATTDVNITIACNDGFAPEPKAYPSFVIEGQSNGNVQFLCNGEEMFTLDNSEWCRFLRELNKQVMK